MQFRTLRVVAGLFKLLAAVVLVVGVAHSLFVASVGSGSSSGFAGGYPPLGAVLGLGVQLVIVTVCAMLVYTTGGLIGVALAIEANTRSAAASPAPRASRP